MARTVNPFTAPRNSTRGETAIREFSDSSLTPEQLRQRATSLLNNKELLQNVRGLTPEEKTRFVDKADQVCNGSFSPLGTPLH